MSKKTKIWLIIAASLIVLGAILFTLAMTAYKWDFYKLETKKYVTNEYTVNEQFNKISATLNTADITFAPSDDGITKVVCYETEGELHSVSVENGTLNISVLHSNKLMNHIGINFNSPKITVYIPSGMYSSLNIKSDTGDAEIPSSFTFENIDILTDTGDVTLGATCHSNAKIKTDTGDVAVNGIDVGALNITTNTGDMRICEVVCHDDLEIKTETGRAHLSDVSCDNFISSGDTGDLIMYRSIATGKFSIKRDTGDVEFNQCNANEILVQTDTGDVEFDRCDANKIFVRTETGDVSGSLLSDKVFTVESNTGDIEVPKSAIGGTCEIITDTGDIEIEIAN